MSRVKSNISKFHMYLEFAEVFAQFVVVVDGVGGVMAMVETGNVEMILCAIGIFDRFFKVGQNYSVHFNISVGKCRVIYCGINL